jgi:molybdopterin/thiamine biosynthesis adenylyltransferase/rhodanese-related sulfurtransferase
MTNRDRYIRQITLPQVGESGQDKLSAARVLVIGCGGLANAVLPYLVAAGIGKITLIDGDVVEESNLHRQVLFGIKDIGRSKVEAASEQLIRQSSEIDLRIIPAYLDASNALDLFSAHDIIVDTTDSIDIRYLISDAAVLTDRPVVHAAIYRFQAQLTVLNYMNGPNYRDLYPEENKPAAPSCSEAGVLGTSVGITGLMQAQEIMKIILGVGEVLSGKLLLIDTLDNSQHDFQFEKKHHNLVTEELFKERHGANKVACISIHEIKEASPYLLDVRSAEELPLIKDERVQQIALQELEKEFKRLPAGRQIYIFCASGTRSVQARELLERKGHTNVQCLAEGAVELSKELNG